MSLELPPRSTAFSSTRTCSDYRHGKKPRKEAAWLGLLGDVGAGFLSGLLEISPTPTASSLELEGLSAQPCKAKSAHQSLLLR